MRLTLRISKLGQTWWWFYENFDAPYPARVLGTSPTSYPTWQEAETAAKAAHPTVTEVFRNVVRGTGTEYQDSLPLLPWP